MLVTPPVAVKTAEHWVLAVQADGHAEATAIAAFTVTVIEAVWTPVEFPGSTTLIVPVQLPAVVGVPAIAPVEVLIDKPSAANVPVVLTVE